MTEAVKAVEGVTRAAPVIKSQVMATYSGNRAGVQVIGLSEKIFNPARIIQSVPWEIFQISHKGLQLVLA